MSTPAQDAARGYGNIYTPHAGSMIIQVQRELGLANRTIVLSARKVRMLRFLNSRNGRLLALLLIASWVMLAVQAARIPLLTARLNRLENTAQKLDSLQTTLGALQERYNKLHALFGTSAGGAVAGAAAAGAAGAVAATDGGAPVRPAVPAAPAEASRPESSTSDTTMVSASAQKHDTTAQ